MKPLPKLGLGATAILFGGAALLMLLATRVVIPVLISASAWEPVVLWFIAASVCLFAPMLMAGA
jgi:hypothetical protein